MQPSEYSVPVPSDRQAILCLHCGKPQEVGKKAMSVTCKFCSKPLKIEDVKITRYEARRVIETCGTVTIDKKGHVVSDVRCSIMFIYTAPPIIWRRRCVPSITPRAWACAS